MLVGFEGSTSHDQRESRLFLNNRFNQQDRFFPDRRISTTKRLTQQSSNLAVAQELRDQQGKTSSECPGDVISFGVAKGYRSGVFGPPSKCPAWHMEWAVGQCRNQVEHSATSTPRTGGWRLGWCYCASWTGWCGISRSCISCQEWKTRWSELHQPLVKFRKFLPSMELRSFSLDEVLFLPVSWSANWCFTSSSSFTSGWGRWPAEGEGHGSGTGRVDITEALEVSGGIWR